MSYPLPSLNALRAFEAAARHLSFTKAAKSLHVTQGAISHQVKNLEAELGVMLFERLPRKLRLTPEGQVLADACQVAFERLSSTAERLKDGSKGRVLTVSLSPSLAVRWLMPRLHHFTDTYPEFDLRLSASDALVDFKKSDVHMAIRYGPGPYPGLSHEILLRDEVFPVCAPKLMQGKHALRSPGDLKHHILLEDSILKADPRRPSWLRWLRLAGLAQLHPRGQRVFGHADLVLEAALHGHGVALGRSTLVQGDLQSGRLVRPFDLSYRSDFSYHLVMPMQNRHHYPITLFTDWLKAQAKAHGERPSPQERP